MDRSDRIPMPAVGAFGAWGSVRRVFVRLVVNQAVSQGFSAENELNPGAPT